MEFLAQGLRRRLDEADDGGGGGAAVVVVPLIACVVLGTMLYFGLQTVLKYANAYRQTLRDQLAALQEKRSRFFIEREQKGAEETFFEKHGYSYDWVFVFPIYDEGEEVGGEDDGDVEKYDEKNEAKQREEWAKDEKKNYQKLYNMKAIIMRLNEASLETKLFYSIQRDEIYCKIRAPPKILEAFADKVDYKLMMDPERVKHAMAKGRPHKEWNGRNIHDQMNQCIYGPFEYIYGEYSNEEEEKESLFKRHRLTKDKESVFRGLDRIKLMLEVFKAPTSDDPPGCALELDKLKDRECILSYYPLHDLKEKIELESKWLVPLDWPWKQPIWEIKDYLGEKIALYFGWLGHYTTWLMYSSIFGFAAWVTAAAEGKSVGSLTSPYAAFVAIWATLFLEAWKRQEITYVMLWGMSGFESTETTRPAFRGDAIKSPIDAEDDIYYPPGEMRKNHIISQCITLFLIFISMGLVFSIFYLKIQLSQEPLKTQLTLFRGLLPLGGIIPGVLNSVQIGGMTAIYEEVKMMLNDLENHRTDTAYGDALISKTFAFEFVNKYASCMYVAFIKSNVSALGDSCNPNCFSELSTTLGSIFIIALAVGNVTEVLGGFAGKYKREKSETEGVDPDREMTQVEREYCAEVFDKNLGPFREYAEMVMQFGYATLFSAAFPLAPLLAFTNNLVEIRVDGWKLLQLCRRPEPSGAEDIGSWYAILDTIASLSIVTNGLLVFFVGDTYINYTLSARWMRFLLFEQIIFSAKLTAESLVPDVPESTRIQLERQEFMEAKLIKNEPDDDADFDEEDEGEATFDIESEDEDPVF